MNEFAGAIGGDDRPGLADLLSGGLVECWETKRADAEVSAGHAGGDFLDDLIAGPLAYVARSGAAAEHAVQAIHEYGIARDGCENSDCGVEIERARGVRRRCVVAVAAGSAQEYPQGVSFAQVDNIF